MIDSDLSFTASLVHSALISSSHFLDFVGFVLLMSLIGIINKFHAALKIGLKAFNSPRTKIVSVRIIPHFLTLVKKLSVRANTALLHLILLDLIA